LAVQRELFLALGKYVPFAQHGGSGAASLVRGLVGKNNINTHYLVSGANSLLTYVEDHAAAIRLGDKKYAGTGMFVQMVQAVAEAALAKLQETGSRDSGETLATILCEVLPQRPSSDRSRVIDPNAE
jgi:hypothetical protein